MSWERTIEKKVIVRMFRGVVPSRRLLVCLACDFTETVDAEDAQSVSVEHCHSHYKLKGDTK